jgi:hypothetical protein
MRLVMDLGVDHTSDEHLWFVEPRRARWTPIRRGGNAMITGRMRPGPHAAVGAPSR